MDSYGHPLPHLTFGIVVKGGESHEKLTWGGAPIKGEHSLSGEHVDFLIKYAVHGVDNLIRAALSLYRCGLSSTD